MVLGKRDTKSRVEQTLNSGVFQYLEIKSKKGYIVLVYTATIKYLRLGNL
jgi:predicted regulator of Ras-like GTPase activity (Roadblock/LC7/MglB family)